MKRIPALFIFLVVALITADLFAQGPNSVVRFRIGYGANFLGDIDVELFDDRKPVTVSNFLAYMRNESYRNNLLHRCVPGFSLQGGQWTIASPTDFSSFQSVNRIIAMPPITNEFRTGPIQSNLFGTLAMWKPDNATNGATSQWFFNLGDNSDGSGSTNLNTANGGATVFGRVREGTNVLNLFNALSLDHGILDTSNALYRAFCSPITIQPDATSGYPFDALPVAYTNSSGCPTYRDLFTVQIVILSGRDLVPPQIAISKPAANASVTNQDVLVAGTVSDKVAVDLVRVYWNTNSPFPATVTGTNWTAILTNVPPGTNTLVVEAIDTAGLRTQVTRKFFRSVRVPFTLDIIGAGTVIGPANSEMLELTRGYQLVARPDRSNLFAAWTGDFPGDKPTLQFIMSSNTSITAVFATNLFPYVKGTYNGLFHDGTLVEQQSAGYLTLTLGSLGAYSGRILMNGKSHRFNGTFFVDGLETNVVARAGTNSLLLHLALDLIEGTDRLTGTLTNNQVTAIDPDHAWSAQLVADRSVFDGRTQIAPQSGKYTLLIPHEASSSNSPEGDGFGTARVSSKGGISFSGTLADGTKVSQTTTVSKNGTWPLYVPLYKDQGALVSWVTFTEEITTDFTGLANWFKQSQPKARLYPGGFTNETTIVGSRYTPPAATNRVLALTNAVVGFTNGNLATSFANNVRLEPSNKVVNLSSNKLTLGISKSSGRFSGSVTPPGATRSTSYKGAILQKQSRGGGFIPGTNRSGQVSFGP